MSRKDVTDAAVVLACRDSRDRRRDAFEARCWTGLEPVDIWADRLLADRTGQPRKVCERAMERACDRGLIEYGVSLRTAWPTTAGLALLAEVTP